MDSRRSLYMDNVRAPGHFFVFLNERVAISAYEKAKSDTWYITGPEEDRAFAHQTHLVNVKLVNEDYNLDSNKDILIDYILRKTHRILSPSDYTTKFIPATNM